MLWRSFLPIFEGTSLHHSPFSYTSKPLFTASLPSASHCSRLPHLTTSQYQVINLAPTLPSPQPNFLLYHHLFIFSLLPRMVTSGLHTTTAMKPFLARSPTVSLLLHPRLISFLFHRTIKWTLCLSVPGNTLFPWLHDTMLPWFPPCSFSTCWSTARRL